jgi:hypothetical protein
MAGFPVRQFPAVFQGKHSTARGRRRSPVPRRPKGILTHADVSDTRVASAGNEQREFCVDNLLIRIHLIIEMIIVDRPYAMGV